MKTLEKFWSELIANKELAEKLIKTTNEQELEAFLKENEVDCTKEQFKEFVFAKAKESGEFDGRNGERGDAYFAALAVDDDGHLHLLGAENTGGLNFVLNEGTGNLEVVYG